MRSEETGIGVAQRVIIDELIRSYPAQLTEPELTLIVGDPPDTHDALLALRASGLIHER